MRPATWVAGALVLLACSDEAPATEDDADTSDSQSSVQQPSSGPVSWRVDPLPSLVIGDGGGEDDALARVAGALRFEGGYVVATQLPLGLRVFDHDGRLVRWIGREGQGPGEFRAISRMWVTQGDTIIVYDRFQHRLTRFRPDGTLLGTTRHDPAGSTRVGDARPRTIVDRFSDGSYLSRQVVFPETLGALPGDTARVFARFHRHRIGLGDVVDLITEVDDTDVVWDRIPGEPWGYWTGVPFSPLAAAVAVDSALVVANPRAFEFDVWSGSGRHLMRIPGEGARVTVTDQMWDQDLERRLGEFTRRVESDGNRFELNVPSELAAIRRAFANAPKLPYLPTHGGRMLAGPRSDLWLRGWSADPLHPATTWQIVLLDGQRFAGTVELPERFWPTAIYDDAILGVHRDDLDIETVREYRLWR